MARRILKSSHAIPITQYPPAALSGAKLYPIVWDTIEVNVECHKINIHLSLWIVWVSSCLVWVINTITYR